MKKFTKKELLTMLTINNLTQPKAKYSNNLIITMLEHLDNTFIAELEPTRSNLEMVNRGSLVECIIKAVVRGELDQTKSKARAVDLITSDLTSDRLALVNGVASDNIEIKFSTSFAPATACKNSAKIVMLVGVDGVYLIDRKKVKYTPSGKININNQSYNDLVPLTKLMGVLGYSVA